MATHSEPLPLALPKELLRAWQSAADIAGEVLQAPATMITRIREKELEILVSSHNESNPFRAGDRTAFPSSGFFCEEVVRVRGLLEVQDGRRLERWKDTPPVRSGWVAHLGLPLILPGGQVYGTLCVLDREPHSFADLHIAFMERIRDMVEAQLHLLIRDREQRERARIFEAYREELRQLRRTFPLCPSCKGMRNDPEYWDAVEEYAVTHAMGEFGHGLCPDCSDTHWGETVLEPEPVPLPRGLGVAGPFRA